MLNSLQNDQAGLSGPMFMCAGVAGKINRLLMAQGIPDVYSFICRSNPPFQGWQ